MNVRLDDRPEFPRTKRRFGRSQARANSLGAVMSIPGTVDVAELVEEPELRMASDTMDVPEVAGRRTRSGIWAMAIADFISLTLALAAGLAFLAEVSNQPANGIARFGANFGDDITFPIVTLFALAVYGLYQKSNRRFRKESFGDLGRIAHAMAVGGFLTLGAGVLIHRIDGASEIHPAQLASIAIMGLIFVPVGRAAGRRFRVSTQGNRDRVLIVGSGMMVERIRGYFEFDPSVELVGAVDDDPKPGSDVVGTTADLPRLCKELNIDRVLIGFSRTHPSDLVEQMRPMQGKVAISIVPRYFELLSWRSQVDDLCGLPMIDVAPPELSTSARFIKRTFDVSVASAALIVLSPVLLVAAIGIKLSSPGPVLFRQLRVGRSGRAFTIYKLRTMHTNAEQIKADLAQAVENGGLFKIKEDPRIHRVGKFLRKTSLDEIPQLLNVLKGDMALVGPRPFIVEESERLDGWAARRFEVRPGLTGLWQVSGRSNLNFDELRRLDYLYVASWSLKWDLRIMWHTPACVLQSRGAY
ncbi:MAG: sugar transferase [Acidimicrobiales bacterium]|jgi:exopolysaccharide biosynthesis polyprenyl glycosylphosphotransferase